MRQALEEVRSHHEIMNGNRPEPGGFSLGLHWAAFVIIQFKLDNERTSRNKIYILSLSLSFIPISAFPHPR